MNDRKLLVDLHGMVIGSTFTTLDDGLVKAIHPTTGESWGLATIRPLTWPRRRVYARDLESFKIQDAGIDKPTEK